ncbi:MAG: 4-hydroxy-tetrahydrodipicolinate reductase [Phycisphaerae bacterium]
MPPKLTVVGAAGRMGKMILSLACESGQFEIASAVEQSGHPDIGKELSLLTGSAKINGKLSSQLADKCDAVIDFSLAQAADATIEFCTSKKIPMVMGTTGLNDSQKKKIQSSSAEIPVIYGTNMSVGMNVLFELVRKAAALLGKDYDIEIVEQHHRFKKDAPSGSALTLAENICKSAGLNYPQCLDLGRNGKEALRKKGTVGIHAVRAGDITGIHDVIFSTSGETVTLSHTAHSRETFARGSLLAAQWLIGKKPGLYTMADVLGLTGR